MTQGVAPRFFLKIGSDSFSEIYSLLIGDGHDNP